MMRSPFRRLTADQRGTSTIELALAAPMLALLVMGVTDACGAVAMKLKLQQSASRAIEMATVAGLNSAAFDNLAADAASSAGVDESKVDVDYWLECDTVVQSSFDGTCTGSAQVGRFVSVSVPDQYSATFLSYFSGTITGKASVRVQ